MYFCQYTSCFQNIIMSDATIDPVQEVVKEEVVVEDEDDDQIVTPWKVSSKGLFKYDALQTKWGLKPITEDIIARFERVTGKKPSHYLTRGIFFAHQDFEKILDDVESGKEIYQYSGRGPSSEALHLGHLLPLQFAAEMQQAFDCITVIQMSDIEKFHFKQGDLDEFMGYVESNAKDLIACGFNPEKTFVFSAFKYLPFMQPLVEILNKKTNINQMNKIYGFDINSSVGHVSWPNEQIIPSMSGAFPHLFGNRKCRCLVTLAIDQFPFFALARDVAESLGYPKPAIIASKFLPSLVGPKEKASATGEVPAIFLNDTPETVATKIKRYAFSGGGETLQLHREKGGNISVDIPYIYLFHFLKDEERLKQIAEEYTAGRMLTGEIKQIMTDVVVQMLAEHSVQRAKITKEVYDKMFTIRVQPDVADYFRDFYQKYVNVDIKFE